MVRHIVYYYIIFQCTQPYGVFAITLLLLIFIFQYTYCILLTYILMHPSRASRRARPGCGSCRYGLFADQPGIRGARKKPHPVPRRRASATLIVCFVRKNEGSCLHPENITNIADQPGVRGAQPTDRGAPPKLQPGTV